MSETNHSEVTLGALVKTLRSKNAGVDLVTFDIFFTSREDFDRVLASGRLSTSAIADLYGIDEGLIVNHVTMPDLNSLKFTIRRARSSGGPGDADMFGSQQYAPLLDVRIP